MSEVTPRPKAKRKSAKTPMRTCDALFGQIVRSRGACEVCGQTWDLQAAHGFSRRYRAVRWDERNCFAACRGCHLKYTMRPLEWDEWLRARWGDALYEELRALALRGRNPDLKVTAALLRDRARALGLAA